MSYTQRTIFECGHSFDKTIKSRLYCYKYPVYQRKECVCSRCKKNKVKLNLFTYYFRLDETLSDDNNTYIKVSHKGDPRAVRMRMTKEEYDAGFHDPKSSILDDNCYFYIGQSNG